ncbi:MAG: hypothetical protein U0234_22850 [Sandaracinus sp.]
MTSRGIAAGVAGVSVGLIGAGLGVGPVAFRLVESTWMPSVALATGLAVVGGVATVALLAIEAERSAALLLVATAALMVLGATSVVLGALAGGIVAGVVWLAVRPAAPPREGFTEITRLDDEARLASMDAWALGRLTEQSQRHAVHEAYAGHAERAWAHADAAFALDRARSEVERHRSLALARRNQLAAGHFSRRARGEDAS